MTTEWSAAAQVMTTLQSQVQEYLSASEKHQLHAHNSAVSLLQQEVMRLLSLYCMLTLEDNVCRFQNLKLKIELSRKSKKLIKMIWKGPKTCF